MDEKTTGLGNEEEATQSGYESETFPFASSLKNHTYDMYNQVGETWVLSRCETWHFANDKSGVNMIANVEVFSQFLIAIHVYIIFLTKI